MDPTNAGRMEAACSLLAEPERRLLLYEVADNRTATLEELVDRIAALERGVNASALDTETRQRVYVSLVHNHLPRLADYDIIEYDLRSGDIVFAEGFDDIKPLLEQFRTTEGDAELRERPPL